MNRVSRQERMHAAYDGIERDPHDPLALLRPYVARLAYPRLAAKITPSLPPCRRATLPDWTIARFPASPACASATPNRNVLLVSGHPPEMTERVFALAEVDFLYDSVCEEFKLGGTLRRPESDGAVTEMELGSQERNDIALNGKETWLAGHSSLRNDGEWAQDPHLRQSRGGRPVGKNVRLKRAGQG